MAGVAGALLVIAEIAAAPLGEPTAGKFRFSSSHGFYYDDFAVHLTPPKPGTEIRYTLDGRVPDRQTGLAYTQAIAITRTTILRAAYFPSNAEPSPSITQTYFFLSDVIAQTGEGFPGTWGTNTAGGNLGPWVPGDYEMDPEITEHAQYRDETVPALRMLPSVSVVMDQNDLFDPTRGIYAHPKQTGADWERPASLEFISSDARPGFQINCGIRIQGGWNRRPEESPKHSFRLVFKRKYGEGKLRYPLFAAGGQPEGPREFDELILRSGCNNSWLHWSGEERKRGDLLRDQWMRDTFFAMGHPSARGMFVHLYLNGLYWGVYNLTERPSAPFVAWHEGGKPEHFDVRNADDVIEGDDDAWKQLMAAANAGVTNAAAYAAIGELVDLPHLADFLILNFYGANADWDRASNWYAARCRKPPGPYRFYVWDGERTLEKIEDNTMAFDDDQSPPRLFHKLRENAAFRRLFADRAQRHLTHGGALTPMVAGKRYERLAERLDVAIVAESARWGDYRRDVHPYKTGPYELYTRNDHWHPEVVRLIEHYFPWRTGEVIRQFDKARLYSRE